ncbi:MAG: hypothetical protein A2854_02115 [Parcubacteria group bacterium RIFCSPHIGHO2_01_FULL_56_18]|nr:MAG: hypothetical protein A2854_02115 [Parcubacteria group bacterium RIFCSPHIGHO2_01_FULL_56_18]
MLVSLYAGKVCVGEPGGDLLNVVIVAFGGGKYIERVVDFHAKGKVGVVRERDFSGGFAAAKFLQAKGDLVEYMYARGWSVAKPVEQGFGDVASNPAQRLEDIHGPEIPPTVIDPDQNLAAGPNGHWQLAKTLLRFREVMQNANGKCYIGPGINWHVINISLDDASIGQIAREGESGFDALAMIGANNDFGTSQGRLFGKAAGTAADVEQFFAGQILLSYKGVQEMQEILFFVCVLPINIVPLIRKTMSIFLLVCLKRRGMSSIWRKQARDAVSNFVFVSGAAQYSGHDVLAHLLVNC